MSKLIVIGFCGKKGHGKDTATLTLRENYAFRRIAFADGLKAVLALALRCPRENFDDPAIKDTVHGPSGKTYRAWMQVAGTDWFRVMWGDVWVNWWRTEINVCGLDRIVVPDLRFPNELEAIRAITPHNLALRVFNPRCEESADAHESEAHANTLPVDFAMINGGTINELNCDVETLVINRFKLQDAD